ncbi:MAG TPA: ATPase, T2SS/T4P/T4SS family [Gemmatimonadaceae bacterium]|nr:ATPase, T2SS/T4P/T4SS family [Gemmatimonadaceae bacterium]
MTSLEPRRELTDLAERLRLPLADLESATEQAARLVPERWARKYVVLPLTVTDRSVSVATADPFDVECEHTIAFATGRDVAFHLADRDAILAHIDELYRGERREPERLLDIQVLGKEQHEPHPAAADQTAGPSMVALVDELLVEAIGARASDIHIEAEEQGLAVRHRVDGVLRLARNLPRSYGPALVSRIKIISGLNIADRLRPQDGRARVAVNGSAVDLRVSTLPSAHGEKVVIRVLDASGTVLTLENVGFDGDDMQRIDRLLGAREGLILVTGPTGSGKTTTLYATLRRLKARGVNIVTVEDPIEYRIAGIVQVQVNEKAGLTFAAALRSIMRQDPDVLLIGEIRDRETAEIAIQASLTGHLVLSTLHTNDAASAVTRLIDIGVAPYKIATAVKGVVAQRLVRRLCEECSVDGEISPASPLCRSCGGTGYRGRLPIAEILVGSGDFEARVAAGDTVERISDAARAGGMRSLWGSGLAHVAAGRTTIAEVRRVATEDRRPGPDDPGAANPVGGYAPPEPAVRRPRVTMPAIRMVAESRTRAAPGSIEAMAELRIGSVDVYVIRPEEAGWRVLLLRRSAATRCPGSWETVHGTIEPGEEPEQAALREVAEETGLTVQRLYSITVQPFYLPRSHVVMLGVGFAAFVAPGEPALDAEHDHAEWLTVGEALERFHWPRERDGLRDTLKLLAGGDAGPAEDVLRVY